MTLPEKIMEYMLISEKLKGTKVFVTVNMRSYITDEKIEQLFKSVLLHKINLICIENKEYSRLDTEKVIIIDEDMCVI
ncbi:CRISPR-associated protein Csn2 [Ruminococcus albus]|uniref:CRISPR-associated protein Csn2 n=2 Tax=Ruminococcus albus TaxID=1264 RepID=A0A1H7I2D2_RUMAL|nr:CRISPR-associated protein Csn2 [Ruminococcus albus]